MLCLDSLALQCFGMDKVSTDLLNDIVDSDLGCQRLKSEHENVN